jgi:hypothetical protein
MGFADYAWHCADGTMEQLERKQAGEFLSKVEAVEEQLKRQLELGVADHLSLVIEGMIAPDPVGTVVYQMAANGSVMYKGKRFRRGYKSVVGWLARLQQAGVQVYIVPSQAATAILVAELYSLAQRESNIFQSYIRREVHTKEYDPYVLTIMGVHNGGAGEEIAKALVRRFHTPIDAFNSSRGEIASTELGSGKRSVGQAKAKQLLLALGRVDT